MEPQELKFNLFPHINISFDQFYFYYICSCRSGEAAKKNQVRPNSPISIDGPTKGHVHLLAADKPCLLLQPATMAVQHALLTASWVVG